MSESGDYTPAPYWSGYDFATAKRSYTDSVVSSGPSIAAKLTVDASTLVPKELTTESEAPLVIAVDVTGSMGEWPATIFSKLPYLEHETKEYLGKNVEISFAAIGDYFKDKYPLQVQPFVKGEKLADSLKNLINEQGGGGTSEESYDLAALYYGENCKTPNAIQKPVFIFIGDEGIYSIIDETAAEKLCHVKPKDGIKLTPSRVFGELTKKFSVYIIRKPYGHTIDNTPGSRDFAIQQQWSDLIGADHVVSLPDPNRVVDVIFGILAKETGRIDYFKDELKERQGKDKDGKDKIEVVMKSLVTIHENKSKKKISGPKDTKSITLKKTNASKGNKKSISLLDDE